ncbi:MAG: ABC transporter substrate-binding protein, partial [Clostridiaceae bacterium]|nr:ABC transporter substrate-binding protein [Clostridiaceae bacterium]
MRNKWWALLLAVFLLLSALVGCNKTATGGDEIIIGGLAPETGKLSVYGLGVKQGAELAIKEINEKGGILGKKIRFISLNEQGDETEALNAYRRLRDQEHIQALIGDVTSKP